MGGALTCYDCNEKRVKAHALPENPHESSIICLLTETARVALAYCIYSPLERIFAFNIPESDMELFAKAAESYLINQLERSYKTLEFYNDLMPL